ncbi:hypothetical protein INS49_002951 [Diaporthe citri]|uniref:uncharacterized protein n=1 Tax=Diaporthe citri TaxID=83186 RepID=UPI001C8195B0|nr:uncharacterized protein INS49_002951 [Diaporthe citri]KAG6368737.1 hypothetical protein INS49_002951 [Diaporthe citri]
MDALISALLLLKSTETGTSDKACSPEVVSASINYSTRDEVETLTVDFAAMDKPESPVMLDTSPESEKDVIKAPRDEAIAAASPALATLSGILRKIEWMGASAWFDDQVEQASTAPPRTKRGKPMKRVSTAVLDRLLNEANGTGLDAPSERPTDRKDQQRKTFIDKCNKGKRLRQIVKVLGTGVLFYRRIWDLLKIAQDQVEDVVSHLSTDPAKATTLALLGEQVELLVGNGRPNTAKFLDAVDAKSLLKNGLHQALGKRELDHKDTITLSGKSIPGDSFNRLGTGEWFDIWLLEAALEIQDRPACVKLLPCVSTHELVDGKVKPIKAPFRRLRSEIQSLSQWPQDGFIFLCPLCVNANHFTLLEINEREGMIYHYDSLSNRSGRSGLSRGDPVRNAVQEEMKSLGFNYEEAPAAAGLLELRPDGLLQRVRLKRWITIVQ